jgi:hypothetical protein
MITHLKLIIREIQAGFASLTAFEAWAAGTPLKERRKCFAQVQKRLVRSILGNFPGPGVLFPSDLIELLL